MHYTELEIIDKMQFCKKSDPNVIKGYLLQLPEWRDLVFKRHIKYINSILQPGSSYLMIAHEQGYSMESIENIFRKIQTCLRLEIEYKNNKTVKEYNNKVKKLDIRNSSKDEMLNSVFKYINSIPNINSEKIKDPMRLKVLKLIIEENDIIDLEKKLGINASSIYDCLFSSENSSIFIDLK